MIVKNIKTVFTIHNIEYQGIFDFSILGDVFSLKSKDLKYVEYNGKINLLKGAITCCDILTTVSPKYAQEIKDKYYAAGLEHITNLEAAKTVGITNGIDTKYYNPYADSEIIENYSPGNMKGKSKCKKELQKHLNLAQNEDTPIIAMISRLAFHKGFDLVKYALNELLSYDLQFVLLGTGERSLEEYFKSIYEQYPDKSAIILSYDKALAKIIYAGADMFLMPSKSEPCGLAQMIASRYGTVPIVRRTGGLYDTISPFNVQTGEGNGITFETYNAHDMLDAIKRALELYNEKAVWHKLVKNVINTDFSWNASALKYSELYDKL